MGELELFVEVELVVEEVLPPELVELEAVLVGSEIYKN